jgi:hypothetical protein
MLKFPFSNTSRRTHSITYHPSSKNKAGYEMERRNGTAGEVTANENERKKNEKD